MVRMYSFLRSALVVAAVVVGCSAYSFDTYAPLYTKCPPNQQWVRPANGLSAEETSWVQGRKGVVIDAFSSYLERLNITGLNVTHLKTAMQKNMNAGAPLIGMAISGGGYSSSLTGTGIIRAFDSRFSDAIDQRTGGLLQSMTYFVALSGGSWPPMSLATYNFPTVNDMVADWHTSVDRLFSPSDNTPYAENSTEILEDLYAKYKAGFNISISDYLGRAFANEFVPQPHGDDDIEFYGFKVPYANASLFEMTPFEFGSWIGTDGSATGFTPMEYLGTKVHNGKVSNSSACVVGYDRASYILGLAASAWNYYTIESDSNGTLAPFPKRSLPSSENTHQFQKRADFPTATINAVYAAFQQYFNLSETEAASPTIPNPYSGMPGISGGVEPAGLTLADGSEAGQSIPFWPLIQPDRNVDFMRVLTALIPLLMLILASISWDNDEDTVPNNWNNGTNIYNTYIQARRHGLPFSEVPPPSTFIKRNYTQKPVLFGCNTQYTTTNSTASPIVLYMTNTPYSAYTNYTWFSSTFSPVQMQEILVNSWDLVTQGNSTLDPDWVTCLGCAAVDRTSAELGIPRVAQCEKCMQKYCWDGTYEAEGDIPIVDPVMAGYPDVSYAEWNATHGWS